MKAVAVIGLLACLAAGCSALPTAGPTVKRSQAAGNRGQSDSASTSSISTTTSSPSLNAAPPESFSARFKKYGKPPQPKIGVGDTRRRVDLGSRRRRPVRRLADRQRLAGIAQRHDPGAGRRPRRHDHACRSPGRSRSPGEPRSRCSARSNSVSPRRRSSRRRSSRSRRASSNSVTVTGEVVTGARVPLSVRGDRLLDLIAAAGGAKAPVYETFVRLSRGGVTATIPMERLVSNPAENIYAQPGDVLTLVRLPQSFTAFGATGANAQIPFTAERMTLGRGAGQSRRPAGSALRSGRRLSVPLRTAARSSRRSAGRCSATGPDGRPRWSTGSTCATPNRIFLAQRFPIEDKDIIYVANADLNEMQKFFTLLNTLTGPVITGVVVTNAVPVIRLSSRCSGRAALRPKPDAPSDRAAARARR